jgi:hypothetical protein
MQTLNERPFARFAFACALVSAASGVSANETTEVFHIPVELKTPIGTVPPCTPLRVVAGGDTGKKVALESVSGLWGIIKVKKARVEARRLGSLSDCIVASDFYTKSHAPHTLGAFNGDEIAVGMPIDFARMVLGPPVPRDERRTHDKLFQWGSAAARASATTRYFGARRIPTARLQAAHRVRMQTGDSGEILSVTILEDGAISPSVPLLSVNEAPTMRFCYAAGMTLYDNGDSAAALEIWLPLAEAHHAQHSTPWRISTIAGRVSRATSTRRFDGFGKQPRTPFPVLSTIWVFCMPRVKASRRTSLRPTVGWRQQTRWVIRALAKGGTVSQA